MNKSEKVCQVQHMSKLLSNGGMVVVCKNNGIAANSIKKVRREIRKLNTDCIIIKNTLARIALKDTPYQNISNIFTGSNILFIMKDENIAAVKFIRNVANDEGKISILGARSISSDYSLSDIEELANLPSIEVLRSKFISVIQSPFASITALFDDISTDFVNLLHIKGTKSDD